LLYPITWILRQHFPFAVNGTWADLRRLPSPPKDLRGRIDAALDLYPCDLLFIHRDAEGVPLDQRVAEIEDAVVGLPAPRVPVVPVRMQEAWLLIDEPALRRAAGNPHGGVSLAMPAIFHYQTRRVGCAHQMCLDGGHSPPYEIYAKYKETGC